MDGKTITRRALTAVALSVLTLSAAAERKVKFACGAVTGTVLTVRSEAVKDPVMVRYLGRSRSAGTLFNEVSLPLGPFQAQK